MANNRKNGSSNNNRRKSKYSELEALAYKMGQIQSGLGSDTKVKASYENGKNSKNKGQRKSKPLY